MIILKEKIIDYMKERKLSIAALERRAGLSIHSIRNILKDRIKKPSAQSLQIIAETIECSLADLIQKSPYKNGELGKIIKALVTKENCMILDDIELMRGCSQTLITLVKEEGKSLSIDDYLNILKNVYSYSASEKIRTVDHKFSKWLIEYIREN